MPKPVVANNNITIFYKKVIPLGRYIENSAIKPDFVIWNRREKTGKTIEVAVPNNYGLNRAKREGKTYRI